MSPVCNENEPVVATGTQEDIDLLIASDEEDTTHLLMLEAKATTGWTNRQTLSKAKRLAAIFGPDGTRFPSVRPHFGLLSPRCPQHLRSEKWPAWMTINDSPVWLKLPIPRGRRHLTRTDGVWSFLRGGNVLSRLHLPLAATCEARARHVRPARLRLQPPRPGSRPQAGRRLAGVAATRPARPLSPLSGAERARHRGGRTAARMARQRVVRC